MLHKSTGCGAVLPRDSCCQRDSGLSLSRESCSGAMKNDTKTINRKDLSITRNSDSVFTNKYHLPSFSINSPTEDCNDTQSTCASQHSLDFHLQPSSKIVANVIKEKPKLNRLSSPDSVSRVRHRPIINNTYANPALNKQFDTSLTSSGISLLSNSSSLWSTSTQVRCKKECQTNMIIYYRSFTYQMFIL